MREAPIRIPPLACVIKSYQARPIRKDTRHATRNIAILNIVPLKGILTNREGATGRAATMGKDLSEDQVASMKEAFSLFDTDGDGRIAASELGILMRSLGGNPTQAQLKEIVAQEKLTSPFNFPRFLELMSKHMKSEPFDRQLRDAFMIIDKDSTGYVTVSELRHILTNIGEKLEPAEFDEWIREVDVGSDGRIRYEDFIVRMVAK
uniref:EF-hand domain-containing protein n=2 Tax=Nelumbo nucifera TaxID=4432 RepID=A0A822YM88_NELNU|nr:TPA_asm: hypothetical protein HUJ06_012571 [Nelumbo nucifera]